MLALFAIIKPFLPLIAKIMAVLALAAAIWWAWGHFVADPYIAEGVALEHKKTAIAEGKAAEAQTANLKLAADVTALRLLVAKADAAVAKLQADEALRVAASNKLLAAYAAREKALLAQIADLYAVSHGAPAATPEEACLEADRILSDLAAHRVRQ